MELRGMQLGRLQSPSQSERDRALLQKTGPKSRITQRLPF
jgi:hypothetical protein